VKKYISLSKYPGKTGEYFYTKFFNHYNIDAVYEPRGTDDIEQSIKTALGEGVEGISVSMPYKQEVIKVLTKKTAHVSLYNSCNTVKINKEDIVGYNADLAGVEWACKHIKPEDRITILGAGAMASMFIEYLEETDRGQINVCARSLNTWQNRFKEAEVIINCTALGTISSDSPFLPGQINPNTRLVIDLAIKNNELQQQCAALGIKYLSGREFYKQQFLTQFEIYTGIKPDPTVFDKFESEQQ
jgi:shikimate dehydrogenase